MTSVESRSLEVLARHGKSFRFASLFLGPQKRKDAAVTYAFCRRVDDTVDEAESRVTAEQGLAEIEEMLLGKREPDELIAAFLELCSRRGISVAPALDLLLGVRTDLGLVRMHTDQELSLYCYRVAGTVGLMMCGILGVKSQEARRHAINLGMAMQLTNIARDVLEDATMNRVYLPERRLLAEGVRAEMLTSGAKSGRIQDALANAGTEEQVQRAIRRVVRQLLIAADVTYDNAAPGFRYIPLRPRFAIMVAAALYRAIGHRLIRTQAGDPLLGRVVVPFWTKVGLTLRTSIGFLATLLPGPPSQAEVHPALALLRSSPK